MATNLKKYKDIYNSIKEDLDDNFSELKNADHDDYEMLANFSSTLESDYYDFAILEFLLNANVDNFYCYLFRSAKTFQYLLGVADASNGEVDISFISSSYIRSIFSSLAIGELSLAREISQKQSKEYMPPYDPKDYYYLSMAIRSIVENDSKTCKESLKEMDSVSNGEWKNLSLALMAILDNKSDDFNDAIEKFQDDWKTLVLTESFDQMVGGARPGEEVICVQALAIINLAKFYDIKILSEYKMVPKELLQYRKFKPPKDGFLPLFS